MNASTPAGWQPRLAPSLVLRHDATRGTDVLLMPERVVVLKGRARTVLELCDGTRTVETIVARLCEQFPATPVGDDVGVFLERMRAEGWLR